MLLLLVQTESGEKIDTMPRVIVGYSAFLEELRSFSGFLCAGGIWLQSFCWYFLVVEGCSANFRLSVAYGFYFVTFKRL